MNIWIYHNFNGDYNFLFMALIIPNWKLYLMFYTFLEHNNYFLMALWFSLHGIALDCCEDVLFVLFSVITQWQWWRELMTVINLWQHSSAAIFFQLQKQHVLCVDLNIQVSIFFLTSVVLFFWPFKVPFSLWPQQGFLFHDLYVLIAIGFLLLWPIYGLFFMTSLWPIYGLFFMTNLWPLIYDFFMTNLWPLIYVTGTIG